MLICVLYYTIYFCFVLCTCTDAASGPGSTAAGLIRQSSLGSRSSQQEGGGDDAGVGDDDDEGEDGDEDEDDDEDEDTGSDRNPRGRKGRVPRPAKKSGDAQAKKSGDAPASRRRGGALGTPLEKDAKIVRMLTEQGATLLPPYARPNKRRKVDERVGNPNFPLGKVVGHDFEDDGNILECVVHSHPPDFDDRCYVRYVCDDTISKNPILFTELVPFPKEKQRMIEV